MTLYLWHVEGAGVHIGLPPPRPLKCQGTWAPKAFLELCRPASPAAQNPSPSLGLGEGAVV